MTPPFRLPVPACIHPETYKYFLVVDEAPAIWQRCAAWLGRPIAHNPVLPLMEIDAPELLLRGPLAGTPVTVIRKASCRAVTIDDLHQLFHFAEAPP